MQSTKCLLCKCLCLWWMKHTNKSTRSISDAAITHRTQNMFANYFFFFTSFQWADNKIHLNTHIHYFAMSNACCVLCCYAGQAAVIAVMVYGNVARSPVCKRLFSESKCIRQKCLLLVLHFTFQLNRFDPIQLNSIHFESIVFLVVYIWLLLLLLIFFGKFIP